MRYSTSLYATIRYYAKHTTSQTNAVTSTYVNHRPTLPTYVKNTAWTGGVDAHPGSLITMLTPHHTPPNPPKYHKRRGISSDTNCFTTANGKEQPKPCRLSQHVKPPHTACGTQLPYFTEHTRHGTRTLGCHLGASAASVGLYASALSTDITRSRFCVCSQGSNLRSTAPQLKLLSSGNTLCFYTHENRTESGTRATARRQLVRRCTAGGIPCRGGGA